MSKGRHAASTRHADYIRCPLFVAHSELDVLCESHLPGGKTCVNRFQNRREKEIQQKCFCEGNWKMCIHYLSWKHWNWEEDEK